MKLIKKIFYATCVAFLSIELLTRIFIFFLTFNSSIFLYGLNKIDPRLQFLITTVTLSSAQVVKDELKSFKIMLIGGD